MKYKVAAAVFAILFPALSLSAREAFKIKTFKYYKNISGLPENIFTGEKPPFYASVKIDDEMIQHGTPESYRIVFENKTVPYFIRNITESHPEKKHSVETVYSKRLQYSNVTVLKLPALESNECYTGIGIRSDVKYETGLNIQYSDSPENWKLHGYKTAYKYSDSETSKIDLDCMKAEYLRISYSEDVSFKFLHAFSKKITDDISVTREIPLDSLKITEDPDTGSTVIYFENQQKYRIEELILAFQENEFSRNYSIEYKNPENKRYENMEHGLIKSEGTEKTDQFMNLYEVNNNPLKITIENYDDAPLTLAKFQTVSPGEEIVFQMEEIAGSQSKNADSLKVYYGNEYIRKPDYDIINTFNKDQSLINLKTDGQSENPDYAFSVIEPPVSIWIMRILFMAGLVILIIPGFMIFKKYSSEM